MEEEKKKNHTASGLAKIAGAVVALGGIVWQVMKNSSKNNA